MNVYWSKYLANLSAIVTAAFIVMLGWWLYEEREQAKRERLLLEERYSKLLETKEDGEKLGDKEGYQLATIYKEQIILARELAEAWKELATERGERIKINSQTLVTIGKNVEEQSNSDYEFLTEQGKRGFALNELRISGKDSPAIGYILIRKDGRVRKGTYAFDVKIESVQLKDDLTGKIRVVSRAFLVPREDGLADKRRPDLKKWKGVEYPLPITGGVIEVDPLEPLVPAIKPRTLIWWPMNLNAGIGLFSTRGHTESRGMADVSLLGYGTSKQDLDWKFINLGLNYSNDYGLGFHILPLTWRPSPNILTNTYLGPGYWNDGNFQGYTIGVQVGL